MNQDNESMPLVVASGGGGLSHSRSKDDSIQHGHGLNASRLDMTGTEFGPGAAGSVKISSLFLHTSVISKGQIYKL
jgi:hypothetical protein